MISKRKKILLSAITAALSLAVILVVGESFVRLFVKDGGVTPEILRMSSVRYDKAVFARHVFKQEAHIFFDNTWKLQGASASINDKGYRGRDFNFDKPEGTKRIIFYGGSAVFDLRALRGEDWPHRVERMLWDAGFPEVEAINAGVPGHTALESVTRLFTEGFALEPDYVLIYNAWNDLKYFRTEQTTLRYFRPALDHFDPRVQYRDDVDRWLCDWSQLYTVLRRLYYKKKLKIGKEERRREAGVNLPISALNPRAFDQYRLAMEVFVDLARNAGAEPILMTQARLVQAANTPEERDRIGYDHIGLTHEALVAAFDRLDGIVRDVADSKGVRLIDASAALAGKGDVFDDHVHLLPDGSEALAKITAALVRDALEQRASDGRSTQLRGTGFRPPASID